LGTPALEALKIIFQLDEQTKNEHRQQIEEKFEAYKQNFNQGRDNYYNGINDLMNQVHVILTF
jgi:hypothetical protein